MADAPSDYREADEVVIDAGQWWAACDAFEIPEFMRPSVGATLDRMVARFLGEKLGREVDEEARQLLQQDPDRPFTGN